MKFKLTIDLDNDAFKACDGEGLELAIIMQRLALRFPERIESGDGGNVFDSNGNRVGRWDVTEKDAAEVVVETIADEKNWR